MTELIALTGATGFVGTAVLRALLKEGRRVRALSRREGALAPHERLEIVLGDLSSDTALERLLAGTSAVVHVAGLVKAPDRRSFEAVNVEGTRRLVETAAKQEPVPRFIYLSSLAAREPGLSAYAASKRGGELVVQENPALSDWQILRPPAVYGPGDRATRSLFWQFARGRCPVPGRGQGRFSLIYVEDLADAVVALLRHRIPPGLYELHDGRPGGYDWSDMAAIAARAVGRPVRPVRLPAPVMTAIASVSAFFSGIVGHTPMLTPGKVRELCHEDWVARDNLLDEALDWQPVVRAEQGFANAVEWYKAHNWI